MAQQVGAALGLAVFTTISIAAANGRLPGAATLLQEGASANDPGVLDKLGEALTHGYTMAFLAGAGMLLLAAVIVIASVTTRRTQKAAGRYLDR